MAITNNLVAHFKLDDNVNDSVASNNGTPTNITYQSGKFNNGAKFNGSNSAIAVNSTIRALLENRQAYTIAMYFKPSNFSAFQTLFSSNVSNAYNGYGRGSTLYVAATTGKVNCFRGDGSASYTTKENTTALTLNVFNTVIVKYDGTNFGVSINGGTFQTISSTFNTPAQGIGNLGVWIESGTSYYPNSGVIDEVSFYNAAFTDQDASDYHNTSVQYPYSSGNITNSKFFNLIA